MNYSALIVFIPLALLSFGQEEQNMPTSPLTKTKIIYPAADQFDIWDLRFGHAFMMPQNNELRLDYFSFNFAANYLYEFNLSKKRNLAFALGLGYDFQRNHLAGYFSQQNNNEPFSFNTTTNARTNLQSLNFPAEFRIRIKKNWKLYLGYQLLVPLKFTEKYTLNNNEEIVDLKPISTTQHGPFLRVGYKDIFFFSRINLSPFLLAIDYQNVKNFQIGVSLGG